MSHYIVSLLPHTGGGTYKIRGPFQSPLPTGGLLNSSDSKRVNASRAG
jgi:hypothetical protein